MLTRIPYIGPYLSLRFRSDSYWFGVHRPIRNIPELIDFINERRRTNQTRRNLTTWLDRILTNARAEQCVMPIRLHQGEPRLYNVRKVNQVGFNSIIDFLKDNVEPRMIRHLPSKKRSRPTQSYPPRCNPLRNATT